MEGFTKPRVGLFLVLLAICGSAVAQTTFVTPTSNTNVVGTTPNPAFVADLGLKQQQEPSCIVRPNNPAYIFCAYNDLRAADLPLVQGDSWMGVSMSNDFGQTWFSRLAPGYKGDTNNSLNMGFAADPSVVAIPGNSPGLAILNYIAAFRDSDAGVFAVQRWVEYPQEDQDFWKPEDGIHIIADGSEGRFIDKPAFYYLVDAFTQQGTITQQIDVEGESQPITVTTPSGTLIAVAAIFTGNGGGAKIKMWKSLDNGVTWDNGQKISEEQNEVTGVSIAANGQDFVIVYRRKGDNNEPDAIMSASCSLSGNGKCSKGEVVFELCAFDQPASGTTFRTFSFPWAASDGDRFWAFAAHRNPGGACVESAAVPGFFEGKPRIVAMSSADGKTWVGAPGSTSEPIEIAPRVDGFQAMPVSLGTKGRVDIAWYDTFREENIPTSGGLPAGPNDLFVNDYFSSSTSARVWRKADVWMTRLTASCGGGPNSGCMPDIESPVRVSQYETVLDNTGQVFDIEGHLTGLPLYGSGTLAFKGDYIALATRLLRQAAGGKWLPNYLPEQGSDLDTYVDEEDIFVAWGDNRDVRAEDGYPTIANGPGGTPNLDPSNQMPYSPPNNSASASVIFDEEKEDGAPAGYQRPAEMVAEDEPDDSPTQPSDDLDGCVAGSFDFSRARDANVYGSLVRDEASLVAPTASKPLGTIQRMFPLVLTNIDPVNPQDFCLHIDNQPLDYPVNGLASFYQLPSKAPFQQGDELAFLDVKVPGGSTASRAAYVTTNQVGSIVTVNAYQGICPAPSANPSFNGPLISSVDLSNGTLVDPAFCQDPANAGSSFCQPVSNVETHDITFAAPVLQTPVFQTPTFQTPTFQTPTFQTPTFQTPTFQTPTFQTPTFQTPTFQTPTLQSSSISGSATYTTDTMEAPTLQSDTFGSTATSNPSQVYYQDVTFPVEAASNVTTTFSADIQIGDELDRDTSEVQLIAWTPNVYATAAGCFAQPATDQQIIAYTQVSDTDLSSLSLPFTISENQQEPYRGAISFFGQPDKDIAVTVRLWVVDNNDPTVPSALETVLQREADRQSCLAGLGGNPTPEDIAFCENQGTRGLITFGASSHSCVTEDADDKTENPDGTDCLNNGNEKILDDKTGPVITFSLDDPDLEATGPDGKVVNYTATATDNVDPSPSLSCIPASGTTFGLGLTTVFCDATDANGNATNEVFDITVVDTTPPTITAPADIVVPAVGPQTTITAAQLGTPVASDLVDTMLDISNDAPAMLSFPLGETTVEWTAEDDSGNSSSDTQLVTVVDQTAPVITPPATVTVLARDAGDSDVSYPLLSNSVTVEANLPPPDGAAITYLPTAFDAVIGAVPVSCVPASGATFAEGANQPVLCSATDGTNSSSITLSVSVVDTTDPEFAVANGTVYSFDADQAGGAYVDLVNDRGLVATDRGAEIEPTCIATPAGGGAAINLPAVLTPGDYDVTCSVDGVTAPTVSVTVVVDIDDNVAPVLTIPGDGTATVGIDPVTGIADVDLFGPIFDTDGDGISDAAISATDVVDSDVAITCDPPSGPFEIGTYTITCTASDDGPNADGEANSVTDSFTLNVVFPYGIELIIPNGNKRAGSTIPVDWVYLDQAGDPVDSGGLDPMARWIGRYADNDTQCTGDSTMETDSSEDSGSSTIRYSPSQKTWQLSWQTPGDAGRYKLIIQPPGEGFPDATACVRLR